MEDQVIKFQCGTHYAMHCAL